MTDRPKLVIFDCDDVLVDSEAISSEVLATLISAVGLATTAVEANARYQGLMLADIGADVARRLGSPLPPDFWERFDAARQRAFETSLQPMSGAAETISAIQGPGARGTIEVIRHLPELIRSVREADRARPRDTVSRSAGDHKG